MCEKVEELYCQNLNHFIFEHMLSVYRWLKPVVVCHASGELLPGEVRLLRDICEFQGN